MQILSPRQLAQEWNSRTKNKDRIHSLSIDHKRIGTEELYPEIEYTDMDAIFALARERLYESLVVDMVTDTSSKKLTCRVSQHCNEYSRGRHGILKLMIDYRMDIDEVLRDIVCYGGWNGPEENHICWHENCCETYELLRDKLVVIDRIQELERTLLREQIELDFKMAQSSTGSDLHFCHTDAKDMQKIFYAYMQSTGIQHGDPLDHS